MESSLSHSFLSLPSGSPCIIFTYRCQSHKPTQNASFSLDSFNSPANHRIILHSTGHLHHPSTMMDCVRTPISISPLISLQINNTLLTSERLLGTVYDITTLCQLGNNSVIISFRDNLEPCGYEFIIQWIQISLIEDIISHTQKLDVPFCIDRIRESSFVDLNSEITAPPDNPDHPVSPEHTTPSLTLSLIDEKTKERIKIPARGAKCIHISCFDLHSWLKQNQTSLALYCDLCHQALKLGDIIIDSYIMEILEKTTVTVKSVSITMDGNWIANNQSPSLANSEPIACSVSRKRESKGKKKNQDESRRISMEHWNEEVARLVKLNIIKITEKGTYYCLLCETGGMTITTLMVSHVSGKKHLICQRNHTAHSDNPNNRPSDNKPSQNHHQRKKSLNTTCHKKKRTSSSTSCKKIPLPKLPFIIPVLNRAMICPISFLRKNTTPNNKKECPLFGNLEKNELLEKVSWEDSDTMNLTKPDTEMDNLKCGESKFLWQDKGVQATGFLEESWGSNQSWVAQLEAQEKHLPD